jgi:hypothetical protein
MKRPKNKNARSQVVAPDWFNSLDASIHSMDISAISKNCFASSLPTFEAALSTQSSKDSGDTGMKNMSRAPSPESIEKMFMALDEENHRDTGRRNVVNKPSPESIKKMLMAFDEENRQDTERRNIVTTTSPTSVEVMFMAYDDINRK